MLTAPSGYANKSETIHSLYSRTEAHPPPTKAQSKQEDQENRKYSRLDRYSNKNDDSGSRKSETQKPGNLYFKALKEANSNS